jgi:hypothetical protein
MGDAIRHGGIENDLPPAQGKCSAIAHFKTGGRLHPGVERQNPECGQTGANGHQQCGERVHARRNPVDAEQHNAEKSRFEKKCRQYLITQQRSRHIAHGFHIARPVGAELERHGDAAHHAQGETQRENLYPEAVAAHPDFIARAVVLHTKEQQKPAQGDGDGGKQNMKTDIGGKLDARQQKCIRHMHALPGGIRFCPKVCP